MTDWGKSAFTPQRLALIGASEKEGKIGNLFLKNLLNGIPGEVVPIHLATKITGRSKRKFKPNIAEANRA